MIVGEDTRVVVDRPVVIAGVKVGTPGVTAAARPVVIVVL